ncbi:MAG: Crp/Fnr family transcriptional regulator [Bacteroidota bacterium]
MQSLKSKAIEFLKHLPVFEPLDETDRIQLASQVKMEVIEKHQHIYHIDDFSDKVFFLVKGIVKIGTTSADGREVIKQILHPMSMFGELGLMGELKRQDFAIAMNKPVTVFTIRTAQLKNFLQTNHQLSMKFLQLIGSRLREAETRLESMIFKDARERIIDFLKDSANRQGKRIGFEMLIKHCLTQQDIANITGTSRQTVTSVLNELKKSNLIYFNRRSILIRDMARLH